MPTRRSPRKGSLQFWPRKRVNKFLPSVNWNVINSGKNVKGFIGYKAGMATAYVNDNTPDSMTKKRKIAIPVTILECPPIKILSVRFYKNNLVSDEIINKNLDKELKRKLKLPKQTAKNLDSIKIEDYDDVRVIVYSNIKKTNLKKTPDIIEIGLAGTYEEKIKFIRENLNKEISVLEIFSKGQLVDIRGLTKGKGYQGPVKRFGIRLKNHKSEKGRRNPGSIGPWHPARVTFRVPMAGQLGMFTRTHYNQKIIKISKADNQFSNIKNYGNINSDYMIITGSVQGPAKRQILITSPLRETKKTKKKEYELIEIK